MNANSNNTSQPEDQIDIGQLFDGVRNGFRVIFRGVLKAFLYLVKRFWILCLLVVIGLVLGWGLEALTSDSFKTEVIVRPNMENKNYLYDAVSEIQANLQAGDSSFFEALGIPGIAADKFQIEIEPVNEGAESLNNKDYLRYLELLENFQADPTISEVIREEILDKSGINHRIICTYPDPVRGPEYAKAILDYINSNTYYGNLVKVRQENSEDRIAWNQRLIGQVDSLIAGYTASLKREEFQAPNRIVLEGSDGVEPTSLLQLKSTLLREIESNRFTLARETQPVQVMNFGHSQRVKPIFLARPLILVPLALLVLFLLKDLFVFMIKKARELEA